MKNTAIKYDKEKIGNFSVNDYHSRNVLLYDIKEKYPDLAKYFKVGSVEDNNTPEKLANALYENVNLWDFLLLTNDRDPINGFPYDFDTLKSLADKKMKKFLEQHPRVNLTEERKKELLQEFMDEIDLNNERNRVLLAIEPKNISYVITRLRQLQVL